MFELAHLVLRHNTNMTRQHELSPLLKSSRVYRITQLLSFKIIHIYFEMSGLDFTM